MFQGTTKLSDTTSRYGLQVALTGAREEANLQEFGDDVFIEPLERLIEGCLSEVRFTEIGLMSFKATIQRFLVNRLRFERDLSAHPEILREDVSDPIIILGMPRTGTTKLQRLISADPQMQKLSLWKLLNPAPFPGEQPGKPEGRMAFAKIVETATRENAAFTTSHETAADEADEDSYLALMSFDYVMLAIIFPSPSYLRWVRARPQDQAHVFEKRMLQYLQWQDGGRRDRRWVLKNPGAVGFLRVLKSTFPRATFVHSHRDMTQVIPSYCRLIEAIYHPLLEPLDLHQHGRDVLEYWGPEMARYAEEIAALGNSVNVLDVPYLEIVRDPTPTIREIYKRAGVAFTAESKAAMQAWLEANQQHKHGKAAYSLERYGLTVEMIDSAFAHSAR